MCVCDYVCRGALARIFMRQSRLDVPYSQSPKHLERRGKMAIFHPNVVMYRLFSFSSVFDPSSKAKPSGKDSFGFPSGLDPMDFSMEDTALKHALELSELP